MLSRLSALQAEVNCASRRGRRKGKNLYFLALANVKTECYLVNTPKTEGVDLSRDHNLYGYDKRSGSCRSAGAGAELIYIRQFPGGKTSVAPSRYSGVRLIF
ncbi:hypothetical protein EVAR_25161_1 [Eumeta japonica]|uniref:Uncharacterized protein n=1 Tax=Eumeta variegata TaxID=151549 RepID=A0A4C1VRK7_EUMVA|nr:hypothetical protein EVAR_25161_1 [Eumeta japonica]